VIGSTDRDFETIPANKKHLQTKKGENQINSVFFSPAMTIMGTKTPWNTAITATVPLLVMVLLLSIVVALQAAEEGTDTTTITTTPSTIIMCPSNVSSITWQVMESDPEDRRQRRRRRRTTSRRSTQPPPRLLQQPSPPPLACGSGDDAFVDVFACLMNSLWELFIYFGKFLFGDGETRYQPCGILVLGGCEEWSAEDVSYREVSGVVVSSTQVSGELGNPVAFVINDSWNGPLLGAYDVVTGTRLASFRIEGAVNVDWESLALGPCGHTSSAQSDASCLYIGDIGDNPAGGSNGQENRREGGPYRIYKLREPTWTSQTTSLAVDDILDYDYKNTAVDISPDYADSEAMFVDPVGGGGGAPGDLYVVTKWRGSSKPNTRVFYIPVAAWEETGVVYSPRALTVQPGSSFLQETWLGAEMSPDGTLLALGTYDGIYVYLRCPGTSVEATLQQEHCFSFSTPARDRQTETVTWMPDGASTVQIPEGRDAPIYMSQLEFDGDFSQQVCPG